MTAFSETAIGIGRRLAADAIWHEGRCSWVGPASEIVRGALAVTARSLPAGLYNGTAGVGLVLAEIGAVTDDDACRRAGAGAVRHSLARADEVVPALALGFYGGLPGIALAAVRSGMLLDEPELIEGGRAVAGRVGSDAGPSGSEDLVGGRAGAVVGLMAAGAALSDPDLVARSIDMGGELIGVSGADAGPTGLSHGGSGVAHALLELWVATGEERFRIAADDAVTAEQRRLGAPADGPTFQPSDVSWCNGVAGIGLARHRAWRLTGDEARRAEAAGAMEVTARWLRAAVRTSRGNFSLCHGLAGNAEALRDCADAVDDDAAGMGLLAEEVARAGIDEYPGRARPWPCGGPGGESPGLMTGLAGIARFYLRLDHPDLPSLLLPRPSDSWAPAGGGVRSPPRTPLARPA
jgi:lantibiotic modifying enzyme